MATSMERVTAVVATWDGSVWRAQALDSRGYSPEVVVDSDGADWPCDVSGYGAGDERHVRDALRDAFPGRAITLRAA